MTIRLFFSCALFLLMSLTASLPTHAQDSVKRTLNKPVQKKSITVPLKTTGAAPVQQKPAGVPIKPAVVNPLMMPLDTAAFRNKPVKQQYQYVLGKVYHFQQPLITTWWKSFADTLKVSRLQVIKAQAKISALNKTIDSLKDDNAKTIQKVNESKDSIDVLGISLSKTTYNLFMGTLVIGLALALFIVIVSTAKYRSEAKYRIKLFEELDEEFKNYKTKANEKEKKLARELQTERNKLDDLLGKK